MSDLKKKTLTIGGQEFTIRQLSFKDELEITVSEENNLLGRMKRHLGEDFDKLEKISPEEGMTLFKEIKKLNGEEPDEGDKNFTD